MAEKGEPITTKMDVDISGLKAGFQEAKREIRMANSEFKAAASEMDFVGSSADGLQKKIAQLTAVQDGEIKKLESLKGQYQAVAQEQGENSTSAQELQIKINNQQAAVNKVTAQLKQYQDKLNDTQTASADLQSTINAEESELKNLKTAYTNVVLEQGDTSQAAQDLAKQIEDLSTELADNKKKLSDAEAAADSFDKSLDNVEDGAEGASGGFTIMKGALADFIGNTISGAIDKVGEFVGSLFDLSEETQEFRSNMTKVSGSADSFGYSLEDARGKFEQFYRYVGDDQMATNAITNLMGMKVSTETLDSVANGAIATWSAYGDSIPIESLTESITESANVGQVTGTLADTINWAKRSNDEWAKSMAGNPAAQKAFNAAVKDGESTEDAYSAALAACSTTQERADLIAQTLNDTYGKSKQRYDEMSGSILDANDAELKLKESQAQLGQAVEPVNTAITNLKTKALDAIAPAVTTVATGIGNLLNWFLQTPGAASAAAAVITAVAVAFGTLAAALAIQALVNGVQKAFTLLNVTLLANPFVLIAAAIAGVVAALTLLWNTNEGFRNAVTTAWNAVVTTISSAVSGIVNFFTVTVPNGITAMLTWFQNLPGNIAAFLSEVIAKVSNWAQQMAKNAINAAKNFLTNIVNGVKSLPSKFASFLTQVIGRVTSWGSRLVSSGKEKATAFVNAVIDFIKSLPGKAAEQLKKVVSKVASWGSELASKGKAAAKKLLDAVVNGVKSLPSKMLQLGKDIVSGIWNGITGAAQTLYNNVKNFMQNILQNAKNAIKSNSPSKLWRDEIGKNIVSGIVVGVGQSTGSAIQSIVTLANQMLKTALSANGNYTEVGKKAVEAFVSGVDQNVKNATKSVEKFVDQQVKTFSRKHKKNKKKYEEAGREVVEAYSNALTKAADKVKEKLTNKLDEISSAYQGKYDEIINLQNTMNQKLEDYGIYIPLMKMEIWCWEISKKVPIR